MFNKAHYEQVTADIAHFGSVTRCSKITEFSPSPAFQSDLQTTKSGSSKVQVASSSRQELSLAKISSVTQIPEAQVLSVLQLTCKTIASHIKSGS
jgi:hypothetical protein